MKTSCSGKHGVDKHGNPVTRKNQRKSLEEVKSEKDVLVSWISKFPLWYCVGL